jgi:hypothetical protein
MCCQILLLEVGLVQVGVDLGGRQVRMTEHFLQGSQVSATGKQVGGETVA